MAISLRSRESVQKSDKVSQVLDRIITKGTDAARARDKSWMQNANHRSELEIYMEREQWTKMKSEREKDLVLMFGEEDVRIFRRHPEIDIRSKLRSKSTREQLTKHDMVDTSGLIPVNIDKQVTKSLMSDYVPLSKDERTRLEQRRADILLRRQQALAMNTYHGVNHAEQQAAARAQAMAQFQTITQLADLGIVVPPSEQIHGVEPAGIPLRAWQTWMKPAHTSHSGGGQASTIGGIPRSSTASPHDDSSVRRMGKKVKRRHHRINCKYHPFSTNPEMRRLITQSTFPNAEIRRSTIRLQHASNGGSNGSGTKPKPIEDYFAPVLLCPPRRGGMRSAEASTKARARTPTVVVHGGESDASTGTSPVDMAIGATPVASMTFDMSTDQSAVMNNTGTNLMFDSTFVLTHPPSNMLDRCVLPDLTPFDKPPRPHSVPGEFLDCDCTPRSTDDEQQGFGMANRVSAVSDDNPQPATDEDPKAEKKKKKPLVNSLLGSASRAEDKLLLWQRDFDMTTVHALSCLRSILDEREDLRDYVTNDRQHLDLVTTEAELSAEEFRVSRHHRCTTPNRSCMWKPVFSQIGDGDKLLAGIVTAFAEIAADCEDVQFPSNAWEMRMMEAIRQQCINVTHQELHRNSGKQKAQHKEHTPPPSSHGRSNSAASRVSISTTSATPARKATPSVGIHGGGISTSAASIFNAKTTIGEGSTSSPLRSLRSMTQQEGFTSQAITEEFFFHLMDQFGEKLLRNSEGTYVVEMLRKKSQVVSKAFSAYMYDKNSWRLCDDAKSLQKKHMQVGTK